MAAEAAEEVAEAMIRDLGTTNVVVMDRAATDRVAMEVEVVTEGTKAAEGMEVADMAEEDMARGATVVVAVEGGTSQTALLRRECLFASESSYCKTRLIVGLCD